MADYRSIQTVDKAANGRIRPFYILTMTGYTPTVNLTLNQAGTFSFSQNNQVVSKKPGKKISHEFTLIFTN
jgi:hypothetical protein